MFFIDTRNTYRIDQVNGKYKAKVRYWWWPLYFSLFDWDSGSHELSNEIRRCKEHAKGSTYLGRLP